MLRIRRRNGGEVEKIPKKWQNLENSILFRTQFKFCTEFPIPSKSDWNSEKSVYLATLSWNCPTTDFSNSKTVQKENKEKQNLRKLITMCETWRKKDQEVKQMKRTKKNEENKYQEKGRTFGMHICLPGVCMHSSGFLIVFYKITIIFCACFCFRNSNMAVVANCTDKKRKRSGRVIFTYIPRYNGAKTTNRNRWYQRRLVCAKR